MGYVQHSSQEGRTAVHYAVLGDPPKVEPDLEVLSVLLESGGKVNALDNVRMWVLQMWMVTIYSLVAVATLPLNFHLQKGFSPLHYASMNGNIEMVNLLLQKGADVFLITNVS